MIFNIMNISLSLINKKFINFLINLERRRVILSNVIIKAIYNENVRHQLITIDGNSNSTASE